MTGLLEITDSFDPLNSCRAVYKCFNLFEFNKLDVDYGTSFSLVEVLMGDSLSLLCCYDLKNG